MSSAIFVDSANSLPPRMVIMMTLMILLTIPIIVVMVAMMKMAIEGFSVTSVVLAYILCYGTANKYGEFPPSATAERTHRHRGGPPRHIHPRPHR